MFVYIKFNIYFLLYYIILYTGKLIVEVTQIYGSRNPKMLPSCVSII